MANYFRTVGSHCWDNPTYVRLNAQEKLLYFYFLTCDDSSDTSVYRCRPDIIAPRLGCTMKQVRKMMERFEELGLIAFDAGTNEVCVKYYFQHHETDNSGNSYEYYVKDLTKIESAKVMNTLAETARYYVISRAFFLALRNFVPELNEKNYVFKKMKAAKRDDEIMTCAARGREKIIENRKTAQKALLIERAAREKEAHGDATAEELPY